MRLTGIILLLFLLPLGNIYILSWAEFLRLGGIIVALSLYIRLHSAKNSEDQTAKEQVLIPTMVVCGFFFFIITQFDPLLKFSISPLLSPWENYWFFICSSALVLWGFIETVYHVRWKSVWRDVAVFRTVDYWIYSLCACTTGLFFLSSWIYGFYSNYVVVLKLANYAMLWYVVSRQVGNGLDQCNPFALSLVMRRFNAKSLRIDLLFVCVCAFVFLWGSVRLGENYYFSKKGGDYYNDGNYNLALSWYEAWYDINQFLGVWSDQGLSQLASLWIKEKKDVPARQALAILVARQSEQSNIHRVTGDVWFNAGKWDSAIQEYERILENDSVFDSVRTHLVLCYAEKEYLRRLFKLSKMKGIPELDAHNYSAGLSLALANFLAGKYQRSAAYFKDALSFKPDDAFILYMLGRCLLASNNLPEADTYFRHVLQIKPDFADCYFQLGKCNVLWGKKDVAFRNLSKAVDILPNHWAAWQLLEKMDLSTRNLIAEHKINVSVPYVTDADFGDVELLGYELATLKSDGTFDITFFWRLTGLMPPQSVRVQIFIHDNLNKKIIVNEAPFFKKHPETWQIGEVVEETYTLPTDAIIDPGKLFKLEIFLMYPPDPVANTTHHWDKSESFVIDNIVLEHNPE
jgi:tetratricopeptide (TPR) repeat protein